MPTLTKKNLFSRTVQHPGSVVTLAALMRLGGWGSIPDVNGQPTADKSCDSFTGDGATLIPESAGVWVGDDVFVRDASGVGPPIVYAGVPALAGQPFSLTDYCRGVVATDEIFVYSVATQPIQVIFQSV